MYIMIHVDALGSVIGAFLIFIFAIYSFIYIRAYQSSLMILDFILIQLSLFIFLVGYAFYASSLDAKAVLFWTRICYGGASLTVGSSYRFYESIREEPHRVFCRVIEGISLLLLIAVLFSKDLLFTEVLNPDKTHSSVIKGELFLFFVLFLITILAYTILRTGLYIFSHRESKDRLKPVFYGLIVFFLAASFDGIFAAVLSLTRPQLWIGPTSMAFALTVYAARLAKAHHDELKIIRKEKERIYHNLIHDKLTGLYTRDYLFESLNQNSCQQRRNDRECCLLYIDLDNFKLLNDDLGHRGGDNLLQEFGACLLKRTRNYDIPARVGGDEFVILLPDSTIPGAKIVAQNIQDHFFQLIQATYPEWAYRNKLSLSIGLLTKEYWTQDPELLLSRADKAMYQAKKSGKNRIFLYGDTPS